MRITILTIGSRGDIQPYAALGVGLRRVGFEVVIGTHGMFREWLEGHGLEVAPVEGNPRELLDTEAGRRFLEAGANGARFVRGLIEIGEPMLDRMNRDSWAACQGTGAILFSPLAMGGISIAENLGVPAIPAYLQPIVRNSAYPCMGLDPGWQMPGFMNYATYLVGEQLLWLAARRFVNPFRRDVLGLNTLGIVSPSGRLYRGKMPFLLGYSSSLVPSPGDWPANFLVTGYWFLDRPAGWRPPLELEAFLAAGDPPVYVGFGSMMPRDSGRLAETVVGALRGAGVRGVLLSGWGGLGKRDTSDDLFVVDNVPHDWLFPQMAAVVHHGGAGTTGAGVRAGVPSLVLPFFADQPFWGRMVARAGAGPEPIMQSDLSLPRLTAAIRQAVSDGAMRARAARLGEAIRAEDGVGRAVAAVQQALGVSPAGGASAVKSTST